MNFLFNNIRSKFLSIISLSILAVCNVMAADEDWTPEARRTLTVASSSDASEIISAERSIRLIGTQDRQTLMRFCIDHAQHHQNFRERDFSALTFKKILINLELTNTQKSEHYLDDIFGIYGCYVTKAGRDESLAGIIKMLGANSNHNGVIGYAECEMAMHPSYRGRGLGALFRTQFHDQVVSPILGTTLKFQGNQNAVFHGTIGYVHAYNIASRRMVTKLGFVPVRLTMKPYFGGNEALEIMYIHPPFSESYELAAPLSGAVVGIILENNPDQNSEIPIKYLNQKPILLKCLEDSRLECRDALREQNIDVPLARMFIENLKILLPVFSKFKDQPLLTLAQEIAVLEDIKYLGEEHTFSENRHFIEFLQEKDIAGKRLKFKELMLAS